MSLSSKQVLLKNVEHRLADKLTAANVNSVLMELCEEIANYNVETVGSPSLDARSEEYLKAFLEAKQVEGRSKKTLTRYKYIIEQFSREVSVTINNVNIYHLRGFLMGMRNRGISDRTIEGYRSVFSSYFGWLHKEGLLQLNPCANINAIKCSKKVKPPFSDVEIERLKEACKDIRDKAIVCFLLSTGCRVSEVCELNRDQIDFHNLECTVHGKGDKERTVYIDSVTAMLLKRYFDKRKDTSPALFVGKGSGRLTPGGIRFMLKELGAKAQVDNVHPHRFRRTLATNLINHGMSIQEVATILGHDKLDTTMRYVFIENENVKISYRRYYS